MEQYISALRKSLLFSGMGEKEITAMTSCMGVTLQEYQKGEYVFRQGEFLKSITILVEGKLYIQKDDYWGNLNILNEIKPGEMFGESYIPPNSGPLLNDVAVIEKSMVLFFNIDKILTVCPSACRFHSLFIKNLFYTISSKNRNLVQKLEHVTKRSTREKLLSYLSDEARRQGNCSFFIPFNRQQLAAFLSVDRSAMSNELCKMRDDGLLTFHKNHFTLTEQHRDKIE